jgi:hypothetical protein
MTRSMDSELDSVHTEFEQRLLASARGDEPPAGETQRAWQRFAARAGALAPLAMAAGTEPLWWRSARASALKWTLLGALGGGSLVAVWLRTPLSASGSLAGTAVVPGVPAGSAAWPEVAPAVVPGLAPPSAAGAAPAAEAAAAEAAAAATPVARRAAAAAPAARRAAAAAPASRRAVAERHLQRKASASAQPSSAQTRPSSGALRAASLAREVAALDAARSALAVGANASALRQIERYHRDFPAGELAADADVVAIEALAADGEQTAVRRAAELFLERRPHDPHAARVRELAR